MKTWAGRGADFSYTGSVAQGTEITYGVKEKQDQSNCRAI